MTSFTNEIKARLRRFQKWIYDEDLDAIYLTPGNNFYYTTGFDTNSMERLLAVVITPENAVMISPLMLEEQAEDTHWPGEIITWKDTEDPYKYVREVFSSNKIRSLAIERSLSYSSVLELKRSGITRFAFVDDKFNSERLVKSETELEFIQTAIKRSEVSYGEMLKEIRKGMTEVELAGILEYHFKRHSLQAAAFESIVAFGENSAVPHHSPSGRKLKSGDMILIDFGGKYSGYESDTTRTCVFNSISPELKTIYNVVEEAQQKALDNVSAKSKYSSIDRSARDYITEKGYGNYFTHRVGHGLGIAVHEEPYLTSLNKNVVQKGTVFTIEPGIYLKGKGGVRIEDTVTFDGERATAFNSLSKELMII